MNRGQMRPELPKHGYRRGLIVDKCATLATCGDFTAQNNGIFFPVEAVIFKNFADRFLTAALDLEYRRNNSSVSTGTNYI